MLSSNEYLRIKKHSDYIKMIERDECRPLSFYSPLWADMWPVVISRISFKSPILSRLVLKRRLEGDGSLSNIQYFFVLLKLSFHSVKYFIEFLLTILYYKIQFCFQRLSFQTAEREGSEVALKSIYIPNIFINIEVTMSDCQL